MLVAECLQEQCLWKGRIESNYMKLNYFNFKQYGKSILMTNDFGKYMFVSKEDFGKILSLDVDRESELYESLIEKR